jgi:NADH dehydrogenase ubiquinone Fe-S protein 4
MERVRIYKPAKGATQSGLARTHGWVLEYEPSTPQERERLMGWTSSRDTLRQLRLRFETLDEAVAYCKKHALDYVVEATHERRIRPKSYADNFRPDRGGNWTH